VLKDKGKLSVHVSEKLEQIKIYDTKLLKEVNLLNSGKSLPSHLDFRL